MHSASAKARYRPPASTQQSRHVRCLDRWCFPQRARMEEMEQNATLACASGTRRTQRSRRNQVTGAAAALSPRVLRVCVAGRGAPNLVCRLPFCGHPRGRSPHGAGADRRLTERPVVPLAEHRFGVRAYPTPDRCPIIPSLKPLSQATPGNRFGSVGACRSSASRSGLLRAKTSPRRHFPLTGPTLW